jgi:hypothetical protein
VRVSRPKELPALWQKMSSQHAKSSTHLDCSDVTRFNSNPALFHLLETLTNESATAACAFCSAKIPYGQSVCPACMKKYNIKTFDLGNDGCGCDK